MELMTAIYGRRSTRAFTREAVSRPMLEGLIEAAIQAPNAVNAQPWEFAVVRDAALLDRISTAAKAHMLQIADQAALPSPLRAILEDPHFHVFYHAPALIVILARAGAWATEDAALAAENLMLAAHGQGLGTCWIGFAQRWLETSEGKSAIGAAEDVIPIAPIIVGHPSAAPPPVSRDPPRVRWIS